MDLQRDRFFMLTNNQHYFCIYYISWYDDNTIMSSTTSSTTNLFSIDSQIRYQKILVPHDGSIMSDKTLSHAAYLSKISSAEIMILNVIEREVIPPSTLLTFIKSDTPIEKAKEDLRNTLEGGVNLHAR